MCISKISLIPSMHICISVYKVSGNIARIAAILPKTNLHAKSSLAATLQQYCQKLRKYCQKLTCMRNPVLPQHCSNIARNCCCSIAAILPQYCGNILPEGMYFDKGYYLLIKMFNDFSVRSDIG